MGQKRVPDALWRIDSKRIILAVSNVVATFLYYAIIGVPEGLSKLTVRKKGY